jgi:hypothetical protein
MLNDDKHTWSSNCIPPQDKPVLKWKKKLSFQGHEGENFDKRPSFGPGGNIYVTTNPPIFLLNLDCDGNEIWRIGGENHHIDPPCITPEGDIWTIWNGVLTQIDNNGGIIHRTEENFYWRLLAINNGLIYTMRYGDEEDSPGGSFIRILKSGDLDTKCDILLDGASLYPWSIDYKDSFIFGTNEKVFETKPENLDYINELDTIVGGFGYIPPINSKRSIQEISILSSNDIVAVWSIYDLKKGKRNLQLVWNSSLYDVDKGVTSGGFPKSFLIMDGNSILIPRNTRNYPRTNKIILNKIDPSGTVNEFIFKTEYDSYSCTADVKQGLFLVVGFHGSDSILYRAAFDRTVFGKNKVSVHWKMKLPFKAIDAPILGHDKVLYILSNDGHLLSYS